MGQVYDLFSLENSFSNSIELAQGCYRSNL